MGGGMVGGTLYRSLKTAPLSSNLKIALIDPTHKVLPLRSIDSPPTDIRTVAISPFSKKMFENVNCWDKIEPYAKKYNEMKVWDDIGGSKIEFNDEELGFIVENSVIMVLNHDFLTNRVQCLMVLRQRFYAIQSRRYKWDPNM
jgi:2-polyprenyl-6-methoxyphenol hydroxylase-like FAD-dependent oxidoreductase